MRLSLLAVIVFAATRAVGLAAESTTEWEGGPAVSHVKLLRNAHDREYWAWVTIDHEDWPILTHRFEKPARSVYPILGEGYRDAETVEKLRKLRYLRRPRLTHPYTHFVNWWVVVGPKGEVLHKRHIEQPHPGGWPYTLLEKGIKVPLGVTKLTFKAHDKIHGYGTRTVTVDLLQQKGEGYECEIMDDPPYTGRTGAARRHFRSRLESEVRNTNW